MNHFKNAIEKAMDPDPQLRLRKYAESLVISPNLVKKLASPSVRREEHLLLAHRYNLKD